VNDILPMELPTSPPFLKWAGGKRLLVPKLREYFTDLEGSYFEPFLGAGALLLNMTNARRRFGNDANGELIEVYEQIRDNLPQLITQLRKLENTKEAFLEVRNWDRDVSSYKKLSPATRAARFIYLNKTCFNGLYRVNASGQFNVPFGNMSVKDLVNESVLIKSSENFLNTPTVFTSGDFRLATQTAKPGDGVYFDPPYDPLTKTSNFVSYAVDGFPSELQIALRDEAIRLTDMGVRVVVSNSSTPFINEIYENKRFVIEQIPVRRSIAAASASRTPAPEVIISNLQHLKLR
jgi:DNA adenine methylase